MSVRSLLESVASTALVRVLAEHVSGNADPVFLSTDLKYGCSLIIAATVFATGRSGLVIVPEPEDVVESFREFRTLLGEDRAVQFPQGEALPFQADRQSERSWQRISALKVLTEGPTGPVLVVTTPLALLRKLAPPSWFHAHCGTLRCGDAVDTSDLLSQFVSAGYERVSAVTERGQVALRGGIVDFFSPDAHFPVRVEVAFDEVVSIRRFDPVTQVSVDCLGSASYVPAVESDGVPARPATLLDFLPRQAGVFVVGFHRCREAALEFERIAHDIAASRLIAGTMSSEEVSTYFSWEELWGRMKSRVRLVVQGIVRPVDGVNPGLIVDADLLSQPSFRGRFDEMIAAVKRLVQNGEKVIFVFSSQERAEILRDHLAEAGLHPRTSREGERLAPGQVWFLEGYARNGISWPSERIQLFTEAEIFPRVRLSSSRPRGSSRIPLDWRELKPGDYVVHIHHGIGQYVGLKTMTVDGITRDYVHVRYAGEDSVYVPTDQLHLLEKYTGRDGHRPALSRLGSGEWQRTRARARQAVEKLAADLLRTQAIRKTRLSYQFGPDTAWQREFEEAFEYDETPDQARAAEEIKRDMEKPVPMDRLLCGDVGFGKTEVAMRAAFKAVQESKQVAVLVPTTILAEQHYATFSKRFKDFGVTVEVLSRFRTKKEQKAVVDGLRMGTIDIVIGTHRLLADDVRFRDLGLLIIDEEHKFGVAQKERLKKLKETVHVLTLSATPIPRTLNMAMGNLMDISLIDTPPEGRFPVETYVIPYSKTVIAEAIRRELSRGGQVFYVCHRISAMEPAARRISDMVPEASIACAHGRMNEHELAQVIREFLAGNYDVLVSTTIIESGLDFPNVNTLIVENADKMGLAQLYQLRGRVGRRNRVAYAYFTFRPDGSITEKGEERLRALRELQSFGSGLRLALRDLELRGAGNLLGPEQHGFIDAVGFDLYMRLLEEAIAQLQGRREEVKQVIHAEVDIPVDAYLPRSYVEHERDRYLCYKKIAGCESWEDVDRVEREIRDVYGTLPSETKNLLDVSRLSLSSGSLGITQVTLVPAKRALRFKVEVPHCFPAEAFNRAVAKWRGRVRGSHQDGTFELFLEKDSPDAALKAALDLVRELMSDHPQAATPTRV